MDPLERAVDRAAHQSEIDRLRAERDQIGVLLTAEVVALRAELARSLEENKRVRKDYEIVTVDIAAKDARIAQLEVAGNRLGDAAVEGVLTSIEAVTELAEAKARIAALEGEQAHLQFCLNSRDDFIGNESLWMKYVDTLPHRKAGIAGGWSETNPVADLLSRAERAEAERDAMLILVNDAAMFVYLNGQSREDQDLLNRLEACKARAALAPSPAGREG